MHRRHPGRPATWLVVGALILALPALLAACATVNQAEKTLEAERPQPLTVADVLERSREGSSADQIIATMEDRGMVYRVDAEQGAQLQAQGVPEKVAQHMEQTFEEAVRVNAAFLKEKNWVRGDDGYFYGGYPYGWDGSPGQWIPWYEY